MHISTNVARHSRALPCRALTAGIPAIVLLLVLLGMPLRAQTTATIATSDDKEYHGQILEEGADAIRIQTDDGVEVKVPRAQIASITYSMDGSAGRRTEYAEAGVSLGTPAAVNFMGGYNSGRIGVRLSGMYWGSVVGMELDAVFHLNDPKARVVHGIFLGPGISDLGERGEWKYIGAGYTINLYGFHGALGVSMGEGSYSNPQLTLQLGYMHQFR